MRRRLLLALPFALALAAQTIAAAAQDVLPLLTDGNVGEWEYQTFDEIGETAYRRVLAEDANYRRLFDGDRHAVLDAKGEDSASGYTLRKEFSLADTPWLHFRWRVLHAGPNPAEKTRLGDDFAWRLYFVGQSGLTYRALNLVYAQNATIGENWESPYAGFLRDIRLHAAAVHTPQTLGQWQTTTINLGALWRETFGDDGEIGLVGLMTDSDNVGTLMHAQYGGIFLSAGETL